MRVLCICGRMIDLPSAEAGDKVRCPKCRVKLHIPSKKEDHDLIRWFCPCGQRLKARIKSVGREIKCPECRASVTVPFMNKDDSFINAKFLVEDSDTPTPRPPVEPVEEPSLRQERNEKRDIVDAEIVDTEVAEAEIVEAEIIDDLKPDGPKPEASPAVDIDEEQLELIPLPHEKVTPSPAPAADEPIPLAGFEIEDESEGANDGSKLAPPSP